MSEIVLHHYPTSPFAEKMRSILGHKKLTWRSVDIPPILPKPDVQALTGGYRRTPILQLGADIYCDTALICDVLEHLQPQPALYPEPSKGMARTLAQWADGTLFWTAMAYNFQPKGAMEVFGGMAPDYGARFAEDRKAMRVNMTNLRAADATAAYKSYLRRISDMLDDRPYLLGDVPCIADFSFYHPLWFTRVRTPSMAGILKLVPAVTDWMDRMAAIGHGESTTLSSAEAVEIAKAATPSEVGKGLLTDSTFQDDHGIPLGTRVTITAESFGAEATEGELLAATRTHYTLGREDARAGRVNVHFPRVGFVLKKAEA